MQANKFIVITGVSWSGKTTTVDRLLRDFPTMQQPTQFTTRQPRNDAELDSYCFLNKETFVRKLENGDFCEYTYYNDNWYWLSAHFERNATNVVILEPVGAATLKKYLKLNKIPSLTIYLSITPKTMEMRLGEMRRSSVKEIEARKTDFLYFSPEGYDYDVDSNGSFEEVYRHILHILKTNGVS